MKILEQLTDDPLDMEHTNYYFEWLDNHYQLMEVVTE